MRPLLKCAMVVSAVGASACHDADAPDFQTMYFDVDLEPGIEPCGGQLAAYDRYFARIFPLWAGHPPDDVRARIHVVREPHCEGIDQSCSDGREAWLVGDFGEYHEIAHVMHMIVDGWSTKWLMEGVAEAFGPGDAVRREGGRALHGRTGSPIRGYPFYGDYGLAGAWTRYLLGEYDSSKFRQYFVAMDAFADPSPDDFRREFSAAFGASLDDDWDEFVGEARCPFDTWFCADLYPVDIPYELAGATCEDDDWLGFEDANRSESHYATPSPR